MNFTDSNVLQANKHDCTAHSAVYSPGSNKIRPLFIYTDTWCSSGQFDRSGQLVQTGGEADGIRKVEIHLSALNSQLLLIESATLLEFRVAAHCIVLI